MSPLGECVSVFVMLKLTYSTGPLSCPANVTSFTASTGQVVAVYQLLNTKAIGADVVLDSMHRLHGLCCAKCPKGVKRENIRISGNRKICSFLFCFVVFLLPFFFLLVCLFVCSYKIVLKIALSDGVMKAKSF